MQLSLDSLGGNVDAMLAKFKTIKASLGDVVSNDKLANHLKGNDWRVATRLTGATPSPLARPATRNNWVHLCAL